jgi:SHS2 domain-containing protein
MTDARFREFEHSGDVGVEAWGATFGELIENATRGLFGLMVWPRHDATAAGPVVVPPRGFARGDPGPPPPAAGRPIDVRAANVADVLVDWLNEVVTAAATHGEVYDDVTVHAANETSASGVIRGEPFEAARHQRRFDVKAATYHGLVCEATADGFHARIIFDL